jgi:predicted transcriptional regulator
MTDIDETDNVIQMPARKTASRRRANDKWGEPVMKLGFCILPSLLFRAQQRLGLNPTQLVVLLQLADFWWDADRKPFPKKKALAERLGLSERQVQRYIADLEQAGLVQRIERMGRRGKISNEYDLTGLVNRLKAIEPDFTKIAEEAKQQREAAAMPAHKRKAVSTKA